MRKSASTPTVTHNDHLAAAAYLMKHAGATAVVVLDGRGKSPDREPSAQLTDRALAAKVTAKARCAESTVDPDEWFPVSADEETARREAAPAIAICTVCPVRGACLELSLRHWSIG